MGWVSPSCRCPADDRISDLPYPADDVLVVLLFFMNVPLTVVHQSDVRQPQQVCAARGAVLHLRRRPDDARRHVGPVAALGELDDRQRARQPAAASLGFAAVFGAISGATTATVAAVGSLTYPRMREGRLQRALRVGADHGRRRDRQSDPAVDRHDHLRHRSDTSIVALFAAGIGPGLLLAGLFGVYIYCHARPPRPARDRKRFSWARVPARARRHLGARRDRRDLSAASIPACSRRPRPPASPASMPSWWRSSTAASPAARFRDLGAHDLSHRADLHDRRGCVALCLAADHQRRGAGGHGRVHRARCMAAVGGAADHQPASCCSSAASSIRRRRSSC